MQNQAIRETEKQKLTAAHVGSYRKRHSKCTTLFRHAKAHRCNGAYFCVLSGYISGQEERLETDVNNAGYKTHTLKKKVAPKDKGFAVKSQQNHICLQQKKVIVSLEITLRNGSHLLKGLPWLPGEKRVT